MSTAASPSRSEPATLRLFVVMGVSGCGKTSVGEALAPHLGGVFIDGDSFHPPENIAKMSRGEALSDADRWPWLKEIGRTMAEAPGVVIAGCSALKRGYREAIRDAAGEPVLFIHLAGSAALIGARMAARRNHFMPVGLLASQLATLEPPGADETAVTVSIEGTTAEIVDEIVRRIEGREERQRVSDGGGALADRGTV